MVHPPVSNSPVRSKKYEVAAATGRFNGIKLIATGVLGLTAAIALWEGILRLTVESSQGIHNHPVLGIIDSPGPMLQTKEGFNRVSLNSLGMRASEPTPKPVGEYRILMLGDSFTRADEVSDGLNFSDRLQTALDPTADAADSDQAQTFTSTSNRQTVETIQVINAGKPSASPAGYLYAADFHQQTFAPDSTVIQLTEHDFIMDMSNEYSEFYLEKTGEDTYKVKRNEAFGSADPLAQKVIDAVPQARSLLQMSTLRIGGRNLNAALSPTDSHAEAETTLSAEDETATQAKDAAMVRWTVQQLNQQFPNLVILFIPAMNYQDAAEVSSEPRNAAIENALTAATADQDVPFVNMRADFLAHYRSDRTHLKGFNNTIPGEGHLNATGHTLVAQRLARFYQQPNSPLRRN